MDSNFVYLKKQIVKIILNELGKSEDLISYVADPKGHDQRYAIDLRLIKN